MSAKKGLAIATEVDNRDRGWGDVTVEGEMVLKNKAGNESVRKFRSTILEAADTAEGDRSIITFSKPRDVRGTRGVFERRHRSRARVVVDDGAVAFGVVAADPVPQIGPAGHGGVLVHTVMECLNGGLYQPLRRGNVRKSLRHVDRPVLLREGGHFREDGGPQMGQLALQLHRHAISRRGSASLRPPRRLR